MNSLISSAKYIFLKYHYLCKKKRQNDALLKLNQFSIDLSTLSSEDDLEIFITRQIKEFTGASGAFFSSYDAESRILTPKHIEMESGLLREVVN